MEQKHFYKFTERNNWEGETWHFFLLLTKEQLIKIKQAIDVNVGNELFRAYSISNTPTTKREVDALVKNSDGGYMQFYNRVSKVVLPKTINLQAKDIFYKGGCWKVDRNI